MDDQVEPRVLCVLHLGMLHCLLSFTTHLCLLKSLTFMGIPFHLFYLLHTLMQQQQLHYNKHSLGMEALALLAI